MKKQAFEILAGYSGVISHISRGIPCLDPAGRLRVDQVFSKEKELQLQGSKTGRG